MLSFSRFFPLLAIFISVLAWYDPSPIIGWENAVTPLSMTAIFFMGLSLHWQDFKRVWNTPKPIALGVVLQFSLMPLFALIISKVLSLSDDLTLGLLLLGCCSGGIASNMMTFIAKGDLALSISMSFVSTLWGVILTPYLFGLYSGLSIQIDPLIAMYELLKILIIPIVLGVMLNTFIPKVGKSIQAFLPDITSGVMLMIIAIGVSINAAKLSEVSLVLVGAIILLNILGFIMAYACAKALGLTEVQARTISFEVGMQSSGSAVGLSLKFFSVMASIPSILFGVWQNISAALIAGYWKWSTEKKIKELQQHPKTFNSK